MKSFLIAAIALAGLCLADAGEAAPRGFDMPVSGATSQPVGHYEFCKRYAAMCGANASGAGVKLDVTLWDRLVEVNNAVNASIFPRTDEEMYGVPEVWSYPTTQGDCEDFVLLKQYMLERGGVPASALLITVVRQPNGDGHAVLTVRTDRGEFVLDNLDDAVRLWTDTPYQFLKRQSVGNAGKWVAIADDRDLLVGSVR
ncbi:transglutaminase-like cysteine peptidase [Aurantimonas sp. Leaf443]|uniref:transglutaminase-like cysteine peptidase n=1 Tax=Aurantimonas sp. Leaf443 TaxID=1736378 RepID=UPI000700165B|nr:transglutaminase-like cysteine peptidase [Aurantimonas sp. Leaf443]KQT86301.1 transglutaminase [Aurantimonas sp. Leaf443]